MIFGRLTSRCWPTLLVISIAQAACSHSSEGACLRDVSRKGAIGRSIIPDSVTAMRLAFSGAACAGYGQPDVVTGFQRDSAGYLIQFGPPRDRAGGAVLIRVGRAGMLSVLERSE